MSIYLFQNSILIIRIVSAYFNIVVLEYFAEHYSYSLRYVCTSGILVCFIDGGDHLFSAIHLFHIISTSGHDIVIVPGQPVEFLEVAFHGLGGGVAHRPVVVGQQIGLVQRLHLVPVRLPNTASFAGHRLSHVQ